MTDPIENAQPKGIVDMTPHEALKLAVALLNDWRNEDALKTMGVDRNALPDIVAQLHDLARAYEPYAGDDHNGPHRVPHPCRCTNCGLSFSRFWLPADSERVSLLAKRGSFCPRCYATEGIQVVWDAENARLPMSFSGNVTGADLVQPQAGAPFLNVNVRTRGTKKQLEDALDAVKSGEMVTMTTMPHSKAV